jgi:small redox-active disulfide protein 2
MRNIQILGTGCAKCKKLEELSRKAADDLGIQYQVEKIQDIDKIMEFGVVFTPALAVDGVLKTSGRIPTVEEIKKLISV